MIKMENIEENIRTIKPKIAGVLLILAGVIGIISWSQFLLNESLLKIVLQNMQSQITYDQLKGLLFICGTIGVILSVFPILGGVLSYRYKKWMLCAISSIIGLLIIGLGLLSTILSLISLIILMVSKNEFE